MYFISGDLVSQAPTTKTPPPTFSRKQSSKSKKSESNRNKSGSGNRVVPDFDTVYSRGGITIRTQRCGSSDKYFHQSQIPNLRIFLTNIYHYFIFNLQTEKKHTYVLLNQ